MTSEPAVGMPPLPSPTRFRPIRTIAFIAMWLAVSLLTVWALAALYIDVRIPFLRLPLTVLYLAGILAILVRLKANVKAAAVCLAGFCLVLLWWSTLTPTNEADWQDDNQRTAWAQIDGDRVTIHNLRNCDYRSEQDYSNCWTDRTVYLSQLRAADVFFVNWGPKWIDHLMVSFDFGNNQHIAFSVETRSKVGQTYSAILGFFRQYELIMLAADERDVVRLRTNYRKDEEVYLYRTTVPVDDARSVFLAYVDYLNRLRDHPEWYNAVTRNCTTAMDKKIVANIDNPKPWNYRILVNGTLDHLLYERNRLLTGGLPFDELKQREHINAAGKAAGQSPDYSALIRVGRVGF